MGSPRTGVHTEIANNLQNLKGTTVFRWIMDESIFRPLRVTIWQIKYSFPKLDRYLLSDILEIFSKILVTRKVSVRPAPSIGGRFFLNQAAGIERVRRCRYSTAAIP
jgi:hypothetical protein